MDPIAQIVGMLNDASAQRRIAAAVVLSELRATDPGAIAALGALAKEPLDALAVPAIEALGAGRSPKALPALLDCLARPGEVAAAARKAIAAIGAEAVPEIKARLEGAGPALRAALSEALAAVGGRASFETLLKGLYDADREAVQHTALAVRHEIRDASPRERATMLSVIEKFLAARRTEESEPATRAGLKILGYLELPETIPLLLGYTKEILPPAVRIEALTSLRYPMAVAKDSAKGLSRVVDLLEDKDSLVRRTARETLSTLPMKDSAAPELLRLSQGADAEVARFAIARLGELSSAGARAALSRVLGLSERGRVQEAARAMAKLPDGAKELARALSEATDEALAQVLSESLLPLAKGLGKAEVARLLEEATARIASSAILARYLFEPVREADATAWAKALREQAVKLFKKEPDRALPLYAALCRSAEATLADRYAYAKMLLSRSRKDAHPLSRQKDPALSELARLAEDGFALAKTLVKDRSLSEDDRFYVGFDFVERQSAETRSAGALLLGAVFDKAPRTKLGKAAKNKLSLSGLS
jgi:hypothetical protein